MSKSKAYKAYAARKGNKAIPFTDWLALSKRLDAARAARNSAPAPKAQAPATPVFDRAANRIDVMSVTGDLVRFACDASDERKVLRAVKNSVKVSAYTSQRGERVLCQAKVRDFTKGKLSAFTVKGVQKLAA